MASISMPELRSLRRTAPLSRRYSDTSSGRRSPKPGSHDSTTEGSSSGSAPHTTTAQHISSSPHMNSSSASQHWCPRPQKNLLIYHGCLAPRAKDRDRIVAFGRAGSADRHPGPDLPLLDLEMFDEDQERRPSRHRTWSELMERVWDQ